MERMIREATAADLTQLVALLQQVSLDKPREDPGPPLPEAYQRAFREVDADPRQHLLVAEVDGRIVGTVVLIIVPNLSYQGRPWAELENMVVDESHRGRGIGEALVRRAESFARDAGCYKLTLTSSKRRTDAHRFYERLGFGKTHEGFRMDLA